MGLRFRTEAQLISSKGSNYLLAGSPITIIPASQVVAIQRVGIYRLVIVAAVACTVQFQDTGSNILSAQFPLGVNGSFVLDTPINGDPWWQGGAGLGLQLLLTGAGASVAADIWVAMGA
jgi:hypothetical protein